GSAPRRSAARDRVRQGADALDGDVDGGAGGDGAHTGGGAGEHQVAGQQGRHGGDLGDQVGDGTEHVRGGALLGDLAVDAAGDLQVRGVQVGLDPGADGAGGVEGLGAEPLVLRALGVTGGEVVGAGVAEHVI